MRNIACRFIVAVASMLIIVPAWSDNTTGAAPAVSAANKSAAGKRIIGTPKTEAAMGFKPYPGAMLELNESIEDCADAKNDRTSFIYTTMDSIAKVRTFYGITPRDGNRLGRPEDGKTLAVAGNESGTKITFRIFPPKPFKK